MASEFFYQNPGTLKIRRIYAAAGKNPLSGINAIYCEGCADDILQGARDLAAVMDGTTKSGLVYYPQSSGHSFSLGTKAMFNRQGISFKPMAEEDADAADATIRGVMVEFDERTQRGQANMQAFMMNLADASLARALE